jgi:hypothetical protein
MNKNNRYLMKIIIIKKYKNKLIICFINKILTLKKLINKGNSLKLKKAKMNIVSIEKIIIMSKIF